MNLFRAGNRRISIWNPSRAGLSTGALLLLLAACVGAPPTSAPTADATGAPVSAPHDSAPEAATRTAAPDPQARAGDPPPVPEGAPAEIKVARKPPPEPPQAPPRRTIPDIAPWELIGLEPDEIAALLGAPALKRREPPAAVWQYRTTDCVLDIVLYDGAGGEHGYRVTYLEARDRDARPTATPPCLNAMLIAHAGRDGAN